MSRVPTYSNTTGISANTESYVLTASYKPCYSYGVDTDVVFPLDFKKATEKPKEENPLLNWFSLEDDMELLLDNPKLKEPKNLCRVTLGDLKRYMLGEILEALQEKEGAEAPSTSE